jgi:hypothetical protein
MGFSHTGFQIKTAWQPVEYAFVTEYSDGYVQVRPRFEIPKDEWEHVAMTYEALSGPDANGDYTGTIKCYLNGIFIGSQTDAKYQADFSNKQCIGRRAGYYLDGKLDEFVIYRKALSESQIYGLATGDYDPVNLPDTEIEFDINNDGSVNLIDFAEISKYWLKSSY